MLWGADPWSTTTRCDRCDGPREPHTGCLDRGWVSCATCCVDPEVEPQQDTDAESEAEHTAEEPFGMAPGFGMASGAEHGVGGDEGAQSSGLDGGSEVSTSGEAWACARCGTSRASSIG